MTNPDAIRQLHIALKRLAAALESGKGSPGADERGVDATMARLSVLRLAADARRSKLEHANMAEAITRMNEADIAYRVALSAVSSAERVSLLDYLK